MDSTSFTFRNDKIRIIGTGYWRKGKQIYEKENIVMKKLGQYQKVIRNLLDNYTSHYSE